MDGTKTDKPRIYLKSYVGTPKNKRWVTKWEDGARFVNVAWMAKAMLFVRERNRTEHRGVHQT